jgi:hypothetical protein
MLRKLGLLGFVLAALTTLLPNTAPAAVYYPHPYYAHPAHMRYNPGYYYRGGRWVPYRGYGHPYRGGYYDRWGHWHRY